MYPIEKYYYTSILLINYGANKMKDYQTVNFKGKDFNIDDSITSKNLNQMQEKEIIRLTVLIEDYKTLLENCENKIINLGGNLND